MNAATQQETLVLDMELSPKDAKPLAVQQVNAVALSANSPAAMMMQALERGVSFEQIGQMMALQERWEANEAKKAYNTAFAAFKAEVVEIIKRKRVHFSSNKGGQVDYKHAELSDVVEAVSPALSRHGLGASWSITKQERNWIEITCTLKHAMGHSESVTMGGPPDESGGKNPVQMITSTKTMLERQTLKAVCGVAEKGEDDDGRGGKGRAADKAPDNATKSALDDGQAASMNGMKALTTWWGALAPRTRSELQKDYPALRRAAAAADQEQHHA